MENSLGVKVTKSSQILIIMTGIPGSGKSTKSKSLVNEGCVHSTDDVIESKGDYRLFFEKMIKDKNFLELNRAHSTNLKNAVKSMIDGKTPVIIDNTNIKPNESKAYVIEALNMGYSDENILIVDVGTGGLDAKQLAERNTHGVPLEKIQSMMQAYKSVGGLTLKKILESKDMYQQSDILYSAVVLTIAAKTSLILNVGGDIPVGWVVFGHHMTICLGPLKDKTDIGNKIRLTVTHIGLSDMAMAVKVNGYESKNKISHITVAVNQKEGGMPSMSNQITNWVEIKPFVVEGIVSEVSKYLKK